MAGIYYGLKECAKCEYNVRCQECIYNKKDISKLIAETKADTVQKIQDAVAVHFGTYTDKDQVKIADVFRLLDQIAKEMLENADDK